MKVEVAVLGFPSLIVVNKKKYGLCGRNATLEEEEEEGFVCVSV